jgi:hypothetical protein
MCAPPKPPRVTPWEKAFSFSYGTHEPSGLPGKPPLHEPETRLSFPTANETPKGREDT